MSPPFGHNLDTASLDLGTATVWLGEDESTVKQQVEAAEMLFNPTASNGGVLVSDASNVYTLFFDKGKLAYADRNWLRDDESKALPSVLDALASLVDKGATNCRIAHAPISSPDTKLNRSSLIAESAESS